MNRIFVARNGRLSLLRLAAWIAIVLILPVRAVIAADLADVASFKPSTDLAPYFAFLETGERDVPVERPGLSGGTKEFMTLHAKGPGPKFRWVAASYTNSGQKPQGVVILIPDQGFVGSGIFWPGPPGGQVIGVTATKGLEISTLPATGEKAFAFTLKPGSNAAVAFEVTSGSLAGATMWKREAYDAQQDYYAFFRGALLGVAVLLTAAMIALYGFRARAVFLAAGGFGLASVAFMTLEAGHLLPIIAALRIPPSSSALLRALIEGTMAAFLILYLVTVAELRRLLPVIGNLLLLVGGLAFAVPLYGFVEPLIASGLARWLFAATAIIGFVLILFLWRRGDGKAETALVSWSAILLWTFIAIVAVLSDGRGALLSPLVLAGLCAVLVITGFTLAHFAFSQGYLSRHFFREAGRRALALAGARAYVWDWQPEDNDLHIGEELERALGHPPGLLSETGIEGFLELMHPSDRGSYLASVEAAEQTGNGTIEREFRLRHGDGAYRWFQLRGRAMPGQGQRAIRCIGTLTDVTNAKRIEERLLSDAVYDAVTGLPNRALFIDRVARALNGNETVSASGLYVILMDIDRFKTLNDALGHEAGDGLLTIIGRRLSVAVGSGDSVARLPGDQFAILFAGGAKRDVSVFTEELHRAVARPINLDSQEIFLTASIGVAHNRESGLTAEQLLKDAAIALYEAKRRGAGSIEVFHTSMHDERAELVVLEQELRRAIERNEIEVHYQPIARLADMNLAGFEALVRWRHPSLGLLAPESFLGLAEQTGMIKDIGRTVLNEAARQLGIWQRSFRPAEPVFIAVNISSTQLIETDLIDDIKQVLHREGVRKDSLKIEVTESLVMQYPERAAKILERLRDLGVGLSCDDFGTGYSSLASLRKFPFDTLKVDRSFISADAQDKRSTVILDMIVAMAHALGLTIVAEGIENQEQVDRLGALSCDLGQGFFIGRPMTGRQVTDALAGLPYASGSGRTAITWLWERSVKEPASVPRVDTVTAEEIELSRDRMAVAVAAEEYEKIRARRAMEAAAMIRERVPPPELEPEPEILPVPEPTIIPQIEPPAPPLPPRETLPMAPRIAKPTETQAPPPVSEPEPEPEPRT